MYELNYFVPSSTVLVQVRMKSILPVCKCGLNYVHGHPEDERRHKRLHLEYARGPLLRILPCIPKIGMVEGYHVHLVDSSVPEAKRHQLAHVAMVAQRSMPSYPAGYDGTVTEDDQRLYILADHSRAIAFVLTAFGDRFWHLRWNGHAEDEMVSQQASQKRRAKVGRVWVAANYRRRHFAQQLVQLVCNHLQTNIVDLGWELPFTDSGRELVRSFLCEEFWGCGDFQAVRDTLHPPSKIGG
jgi:hypothetical protein